MSTASVQQPPHRATALQLAKDLAGSLPELARLLHSLAKDPRVKRRYRWAMFSLIPYLLMPFDPLPDFIPVVGALDDIALVVLVLRWVFRNVDRSILEEHWQGSPALLGLLRRVA